jgi:ABC-2 type transport system permease protein
MTKMMHTGVSPERQSAFPNGAVPVRNGFSLSAVGALFWLTVRQHCRARRLLVLSALFLLPAAIAVVVRYADGHISEWEMRVGLTYTLLVRSPISIIGLMEARHVATVVHDLEFALIFTFVIPHALAPLAALLYASGMIQDEIEEQTLTYLLIRPLPKWSIYLAKFLATFAVTLALVGFFTLVTYIAIYAGLSMSFEMLLDRAAKTIVIFSLALFAYCAIFGCMSLLVKRFLVAGLAYIIIFEGVLANIDFAVRRLTVMYYFRVLAERWLHLNYSDWSLDLSEAFSAGQCMLIMLGVGLLFVVLGAVTFTTHEFRVKTPEGN